MVGWVSGKVISRKMVGWASGCRRMFQITSKAQHGNFLFLI